MDAAPRRGAALLFVLVFVIAMAALAMGSIYMASNANLFAKSYDRERNLKFAAEMALAMGKSRVNQDPSILALPPGQVDTLILGGATLTDANNVPMTGIRVDVYVGPTGSTSGQFGRFSSIVARARDSSNAFIRRLELTQESFAKFAYWSNSETNSGQTIFFNNKDELWGPVWSNDVISIGSGGATFHDEVGTARTVSGAGYGKFVKGYKENMKPISLPSTAVLNSLAAVAGPYSLAANTSPSNNESSVLDRVEFVATDLSVPADKDSLQSDEGFFRYFTANSPSLLRGDWPGSATQAPPITSVQLCGDSHWAPNDPAPPVGDGQSHLKFYPASIHGQTWFRDQIRQGYIDRYGWTPQVALDSANLEMGQSLKGILDNPAARCYLAGDPHLAAVERATNIQNPGRAPGIMYTAADVNIGGTDTTFTPVGRNGTWRPYVPRAGDNTSYLARRPWDGAYLHPIDRKYNGGSRGVIYVPGNLGLSGVVNGRVTVYATGTVVLLDDIRYANDPVRGFCRDILGIVAGRDVVIADNAINTPPEVVIGNGRAQYYSLDDTKDMYIHAVMMALNNSFRVENFDSGPTDVNDCVVSPTLTVNNGRGCIYLSGGIIQRSRGAVGTSSGSGYSKRYSYDHCAVINPPPYFPTTGRFQDNRYVELDPAGFDHAAYFKSLTPDP
jgi:hypothetical protein